MSIHVVGNCVFTLPDSNPEVQHPIPPDPKFTYYNTYTDLICTLRSYLHFLEHDLDFCTSEERKSLLLDKKLELELLIRYYTIEHDKFVEHYKWLVSLDKNKIKK